MKNELNKHFEGLGHRLRLVRETIGWSTREVASQLTIKGYNISHATLGNYERGLTQPSESMLAALASLYKKSIDWIRGTGLVLKGVQFRCLKSVSERSKKEFTHKAQLWLEAYLYTEKLLKRSLKKSRRIQVKRNDSGANLASKIRKEYKLVNNPIPSTIRILEDFGIYVIQLETKERIDAFAGRFDDFRVVVLNATLSNDRIRLSTLHELAHHLYEDCINGPSLAHEEVEKRAFEFASYMLIPDDKLEEAFKLKSMVRLLQYKELYGISLAAMIYRARISNILSQRLYTKLWKDFGRLGYRKNEPGFVASDRPIRMEALFDAAVGSGKLSYHDIAVLAGTDDYTVEERIGSLIGRNIELKEHENISSTIKFETYKNNFDVN